MKNRPSANLFLRFKSRVQDFFSSMLKGRVNSSQWDELRQEVARADRSRFLTATMVVAMSMAVTIVNSLIVESENGKASLSSKDRQLASIALRAPRTPETLKWEKSVIAQLSRYTDSISVEAVGGSPSAMEHLVFGTLGGHYLAHLTGGKLSGLEFDKSEWVTRKPMFIENRESFLRDNEALFPVNFALLRKTDDISTENDLSTETYELMSRDNQVLGLAQFQLDGLGRFIALTVNPVPPTP
jgi:hypothetical protein